MKVKLSPKGEKWRCSEDDITRHSLIHALIELTDFLVLDALEDDDVRRRLDAAEAAEPEHNSPGAAIFGEDRPDLFGESNPIVVRAWEFDPTDEDGDAGRAQAILGGYPSGDSFFLILRTESFEASAHLVYEREHETDSFGLMGAYVPFFKGDPIKALHWVREIGFDLLDESDEVDHPLAGAPAG
jgi:hypothetical protein